MARIPRMLITGEPAAYHVMSRTRLAVFFFICLTPFFSFYRLTEMFPYSPFFRHPGLAQIEKSHILKAFDQTGKNKSQTARLLGIGLNTLRRKLKSYGAD